MGFTNIIALLGGVALFLFGMNLMGDGLKKVAGSKLKVILYKLTSNSIKGILLGTGVTAVIQSSSATSVMVVGFVNSGMMKVKQAISIIMGAIIGTSITGWIISLSSISVSSNGLVTANSEGSCFIDIVGEYDNQIDKKQVIITVNKVENVFGLDISEEQLKAANKLLNESGYICTFFHQPMEDNNNIPQNYFDVVYSIYAIGWTVDLEKTIKNAASYLKQGGIYIFSWDHPFLHCVDLENSSISSANRTISTDNKIVFSGNYLEEDYYTFEKYGNPLTLQNRKLSTYINALADAGFIVERVIEETNEKVLEKTSDLNFGYYADFKAKHFPLSIVIKSRKL